MQNNLYENFQYNSCISRGICSINPRISALQAVIIFYLKIYAAYAKNFELNYKVKNFILNTLSITINNSEFNDNSYIFAINNFQKEILKILNEFIDKNPEIKFEVEKEKLDKIFSETSDVILGIKYGEKIINRVLKNVLPEIRDLYNIILLIIKNLSINLLELESYENQNNKILSIIFELLIELNIEKQDQNLLKKEIIKASKANIELIKKIRLAQEKRFGKQIEKEVSFTTRPNKAVLVVGTNIRELESILEALKDKNIDIYTHDDMILAHTFPKFSNYTHLRGQFGQGIENCLLDFATFPGPIILTRHSLHNIENLYRGQLFTTDYITSPKGIIKIKDNNFNEVIKATENSKGFKKGKNCESILIGYDYDSTINLITTKINNNKYKHIFIICPDDYSIEQKIYFEKLIKNTPKNILIVTFSHSQDKENLIHINTCYDNYGWFKICEFLQTFNLDMTIFVPKCLRDTISQIIYLSQFDNINIYLGKCIPTIINPSIINTLKNSFLIKDITNSKKDLEEIIKDK